MDVASPADLLHETASTTGVKSWRYTAIENVYGRT